MSALVDKATGVLTIAIGGISIALTKNDLVEWGNSITSLASLGLILFLIWRLYKSDQQHKQCEENYAKLQESQTKMQEQVLLTFLAAKHPSVQSYMPSISQFQSGNFTVPNITGESHEHI